MDRATDPPAEREHGAEMIWASWDERPADLSAADRQRRAREAVAALVASILRRQEKLP
jgi:hypothetical protein